MQQPAPAQIHERERRTERVLLKIAIELSGKGADGQLFRERTFTLVVNRHGAKISSKSPLQIRSEIIITNIERDVACPFRVIRWLFEDEGGSSEWGVECLEPESNFWGIVFPKAEKINPERGVVHALLKCLACHGRELAQLTIQEYKTVAAPHWFERWCASCNNTTEWSFAPVQEGPRGFAPSLEVTRGKLSPQPTAAERRRANRLAIKLPMRVRLQDGREVATTSENYCKNGVCCVSNLGAKEGDRVRVTVPFSLGEDNPGVPAWIIWDQQRGEGGGHLYGLQFEESF
jgi:PilZ domain-containing protein